MSRSKPSSSPAPRPSASPDLPPRRTRHVFAVPAIAIAAMIGIALLPGSRAEPGVMYALLGAAAVLAGWAVLVHRTSARQPRGVRVVIRRPHWVQPIAHLSIYAYWATAWPEVRHYAPFIAAQIAFAYAFDTLLAWTRRDTHELGFGPFPIIFSTNLFLWFKPEWFALQLVMVAIGFSAKEFIRWDKGGRRAHVFNPSSFPLAVASLVLIVAGATHLTWGIEIATTLERPRWIYEWLFLVSLPGQILFGVALMPLAALLTAHGLSAAYFAAFGTYFFIGPVPIAVFLGMLLLFTDPATAPRTDLGRLIYGMLYGALVVVFFEVLDQLGVPTFYDKLLPVPLLNLSVRAIDRFTSRPALARLDPARLLAGVRERPRFLVYTAVWAVAFLGVRAVHGVGDTHPANRVPFWVDACKADKRNACRTLVTIESNMCARGAAWACNELGIYVAEQRPELAERFPPAIGFARACELGMRAGCINAQRPAARGGYQHEAPMLGDYDYLLESKALPEDATPKDLLRVACAHGWTDGCMGLGYYFSTGEMAPREPALAVHGFDRACARGNAEGCVALADLLRTADGVTRDEPRAARAQQRACELGRAAACVATAPAPR